MVIRMKGKLMVCLLMCSILYIPTSHATSQSWSYKIDGISTFSMAQDGQNVIIGSSSGVYYLLDEYGELIKQDNLGSEIKSVHIGKEHMILGTKTSTFIFSLSGSKITQFPSEPVLSVAIAENGSCAISGTEKNIFMFPSLKSGMQLFTGTPVTHVSISSTGREAAAITSNKVFFFNIGESITSWEKEIPSITAMQLSKDGRRLVVGTKQGTLYLYGKAEELLFRQDLVGSITSVGASDTIIMAGTSTGRIHLYNMTGTEVTSFLVDKMVDCDISQDGQFIIAASSQKLFMYNESGEILWQKDINNTRSVEISSDGRYVVATTDKGILFFCNWEETFNGSHYIPYPSRELYSFVNFKKIGEYPASPTLEPYLLQPHKRIAVGDVNGDGENEIVASTGRGVIVFDSRMNVLSQKRYESDVYYLNLLDVNRDTVPEILLSLSDGWYRIFVLGANKELEELNEFDFTSYLGVSHKGDRMEAAIAPVISYDIDDDGKMEIIAVVNSGYTLKPRRVLAFEYPSGTVEWSYRSASSLTIDAFCDIDKDGKPEIILGSHACCNGNTEGQRDDCHAYVIVLNLNGEEVWAEEVAMSLKTVRVGVEDINRDRKVEIVGTIYDAKNVSGGIFVMDNKGNMLYEKELSSVFYLGGIADFNEDGYMEIVVTDAEGKISIYNYRVELMKTREIATNQLSQVEGINDVDGDGTGEIIVRVWYDRVIILDSNLEEKWSKIYDGVVHSILTANVSGCGNDLLVLTEKIFEYFSFEGEGEYLCAKFIPGSSGVPSETSTPSPTPPVTPSSTPKPTPPSTAQPVSSASSTPGPTASPAPMLKDPLVLSILGFIVTLTALFLTFFRIDYKTVVDFIKGKITRNTDLDEKEKVLSHEDITEEKHEVKKSPETGKIP